MKSARNTLPTEPANGVTCGIDWARDDHAVSIVDHRGREIVRSTVEHNAAGLRELLAVLTRAGAHEVAIERPDGPVVDTLLAAGVTVVVISPNQVKNLRGRYGSAGNKDDRFDAFVLADTLRTDRARLHPLLPDTPATVTLRQTCRARKDLVAHRVAVANQLRAHLKIVFPGAVGLFADLDSQISLAFLTRFDCQDRADWLSVNRLAAWLASAGYSGRTDPALLYRRLTSAPRGTAGTDGTATIGAFVAVLCSLGAQIKALDADIAEQLARHADAQIFTSLPRSGTFRAARLLSEIGDCRARFPTPESLACLAGVAPSTRQSGKVKHVGFRWAADKQLREAVTDFAGDSRHDNPWAADVYNRAIARGHDHPHAVRILARAWLYVIWHCWQDGIAYDPAKHRTLQTLLNQAQHRADDTGQLGGKPRPQGVGKSVVHPGGTRVIRVGEGHAGRQGGGHDVTVGVQPAVRAVMGALGQGLGHPRPAQAVLAQRGGSGAGARHLAAGGFALMRECVDEHAGAEQGDPLAPQARPGRDRTILDGDDVAVGGDDARGDVAGAGVFGLTGATGLGGVIGAGALIATREPVVAVGAQRYPISTRVAGTAGVGDLAGRQPFGGAALRALLLALRGPVLVSIGVAPRAVQGALAIARPLGCPPRSLLLLAGAADLVDHQMLRMIGGEGGQRQIGDIGIQPRPPAGGDLGASRPRRGGLVAGLVGQQMRVIAPAPGCFAVAHPHQIDLVPHTRIGQEMTLVRPLACALR
jgi:transposase